jgi:hypothetical protein
MDVEENEEMIVPFLTILLIATFEPGLVGIGG